MSISIDNVFVKQFEDTLFVGDTEQFLRILQRAVARRHRLVVTDIVTGIGKGRIVKRIQPQGVAAQTFDIVQLLDNALQVTDAVTVGVIKGLGIDLIENRVFQPVCSHLMPHFLARGRVPPSTFAF